MGNYRVITTAYSSSNPICDWIRGKNLVLINHPVCFGGGIEDILL